MAGIDRRRWAMGFGSVHEMRHKLAWEVAEFEKSQKELVTPFTPDAFNALHRPMYIAANAASTAWHMVEWLHFHIEEQRWWDSFSSLVGENLKNKVGLERWARQNEPMRLCYAICLALKHVSLTNTLLEKMDMQVTCHFNSYVKPEQPELDRHFRMSIEVATKDRGDETTSDAAALLSGALSWWDELLARLPTGEQWAGAAD